MVCHILLVWSMHCQKWSVDKIDKNNTEAHSPCATFSYFQLTYSYNFPIICITIIWTYSTMRSTKIKDIRGQEKDGKDQKIVSRLPRFDRSLFLRLYLLFTLNESYPSSSILILERSRVTQKTFATLNMLTGKDMEITLPGSRTVASYEVYE